VTHAEKAITSQKVDTTALSTILMGSISATSSTSAFELLTRFDAGSVADNRPVMAAAFRSSPGHSMTAQTGRVAQLTNVGVSMG
jgi:hypothetical protein